MAAIAGAAVPLKVLGTGSPTPLETPTPTIESLPKKKKKKLKEPKVSNIIEIKKPFDLFNRATNETMMIPIDDIMRNPAALRQVHQPTLKELVESIRVHGILNSILVRYIGNNQFSLIDGLCRLEAARELGIKTIPATVRRYPGMYMTVDPKDIWQKSTEARLLGIMKKSILNQGVLQPCILVDHGTIDFPSYEVVDGSLRVEVLRHLGMKVPAIVYNWSPEEIMEYRILQGKPTAVGRPYTERPKFIQAEDRIHRLLTPAHPIDKEGKPYTPHDEYTDIRAREMRLKLAKAKAIQEEVKVNVSMDTGFKEAMHVAIKKHLKVGQIGG